MKWIVSHQSALEFLRKAYAKDVLAEKKLRSVNPPTKPLNTKELKNENLRNLDRPLHVLVGSDNARKASQSLRCHISSGGFPDGSFVRIDSGLFVSSPELCFLQMADELSFTDLVVLGYELCGSYRLDRESVPNQGFRDDLPLTSVARLDSYTSKAIGLKGRKKARRSLSFIIDGSASPMETILTILLTLPYRYGGYGFPLPQLNYRIDVTTNNRKPTGKRIGKSKYYCDLFWPDKQVDVEYDSDVYHTGTDRISNDAIRRNALTSIGVTVITVSRKQVYSLALFRELAELLSKMLGKRLVYKKEDFTYRHIKLRRQLLRGMLLRTEQISD